MLGKLLKYEFKSTGKVMWILYIALLVVALLLGTLIRFSLLPNGAVFEGVSLYVDEGQQNPVILGMLTALAIIYVLVIQAVAIMTIITIILRFNKNLLGGEGYLMHTLPVKTVELVTSKFLISCLWMVMAGAAAILSVALFGATSGMFGYMIKEGMWQQMWSELGEIIGPQFWLFLVAGIVSVAAEILLFYVSMAIGNLANKNKFLYSVMAYLAIHIVLTVVSVILFMVADNIIQPGVTYYPDGVGYVSTFFGSVNTITLIVNLAVGVGAFFGTNYILKNKLNLA